MQSSARNNPYQAVVQDMGQGVASQVSQGVAPEPGPSLTALLPLVLALLVLGLVGSVIWRKRAALTPGRAGRRALALLLAILVPVWALWFTGSLTGDEARHYAVAVPATAAALFAAWKLAA